MTQFPKLCRGHQRTSRYGNSVLYPKTCPVSMSSGLLLIQDIAGGEQIFFFLGFMLEVGEKRKNGSGIQLCSARMVYHLKQRPR